MKIICSLIVILVPLIAYPQTQRFESCGTEDLDTAVFKRLPWFGNNEYLDNIIFPPTEWRRPLRLESS